MYIFKEYIRLNLCKYINVEGEKNMDGTEGHINGLHILK
jgi:hypothetical protein